ncbi:group-specific protein [Paenibacillus sp. FSL H8-0034]|uniref:group-specific protein n=1 Tax=Paenibacillus sp. FSL H8-0034 TaxID=2954671 RepID=UPI0030F745A8
MEWAKQTMIGVGDWVGGTSIEDEKIIGYVDSMDAYGTVKVMVTQSDRQEAVGHIVNSKRFKLEKLDEYTPTHESDVLSLMDLALMTRDQLWFDELGSTLRSIQSKRQNDSSKETTGFKHASRRIKID